MIFVDTAAFLARHFARDQHHREAVRAWKRLEAARAATSNLVLAETLTLLARWANHSFAAARARALLDSERIEILRAGAPEERAAVGLLERYGDQGVSFVDCVSFALMEKHGIRDAFTFDRHFRAAGFRLWPPRRG